jgi:hypothetical protein
MDVSGRQHMQETLCSRKHLPVLAIWWEDGWSKNNSEDENACLPTLETEPRSPEL